MSSIHLRHLNPLPADLGDVLAGFQRVLVPELNRGHLHRLLRAEFLIPARALSKVEGQPFKIREIRSGIEQALEGSS